MVLWDLERDEYKKKRMEEFGADRYLRRLEKVAREGLNHPDRVEGQPKSIVEQRSRGGLFTSLGKVGT